MKFLFWQFSVYAWSAFVLGAICAYLVFKPRLDRSKSELQIAEHRGSSLQAQSKDLETARRRLANSEKLAAALEVSLREANERIVLADAKLEAERMARENADSASRGANERLSVAQASAAQVVSLQLEMRSLRQQLSTLTSDREAEHERLQQELALARSSEQSSSAALAELQSRHNAQLELSQRSLTEALVRAEEAEARYSQLEAERVRVRLVAGIANTSGPSPSGNGGAMSGLVTDRSAAPEGL